MTPPESPRLKEFKTPDDIPSEWRGTPLEKLILYHNFHDLYKNQIGASTNPELVIGMCMDFRHQLKTPPNFAYIMRTAGGNIINLDFMVSVAVGVGKVAHMAIIGHNDCAMSNLKERQEEFISGLTDIGGWQKSEATDYFLRYESSFAVGNSAAYTIRQVAHYKKFYPGVKVGGFFYKLEEQKLWLVE